ncbi:MAG: prepilin-type N-terminal cleavage/methylation domain-containing protein [Sedimentisphaerales bacterium]|nr:prepilin-type N-terminal cleavage/methylation domain-containing protein [Sedimentisphaerales bacterium]
MRAKRGFTLVEILIVVVILGILAAIVIPQFTEASTEAKLSSLCSDLQTVRSQIELYKVQHNDTMPGTVSGVSFTKAMCGGTTLAGAVDATAPYDYGPYLQCIPKNPFTDTNTVEVGTGSPAGGNTAWYFNSSTGAFNADDTAHATY